MAFHGHGWVVSVHATFCGASTCIIWRAARLPEGIHTPYIPIGACLGPCTLPCCAACSRWCYPGFFCLVCWRNSSAARRAPAERDVRRLQRHRVPLRLQPLRRGAPPYGPRRPLTARPSARPRPRTSSALGTCDGPPGAAAPAAAASPPGAGAGVLEPPSWPRQHHTRVKHWMNDRAR